MTPLDERLAFFNDTCFDGQVCVIRLLEASGALCSLSLPGFRSEQCDPRMVHSCAAVRQRSGAVV